MIAAAADATVVADLLDQFNRENQTPTPGSARLSGDRSPLTSPTADITISSAVMAQILIRRLDDDVKRKLQRRAQLNGRSTEAEVREILQAAVQVDEDPTGRLGSRIAGRFAEIGLDEYIAEQRGQAPTPAQFDQ